MLRISQNLSLQQKMAPQLIQSLQLLQMSTLDVTDAIGKEMLENPFIEVREPGLAQSASERATPGDAGGDHDDEAEYHEEATASPDPGAGSN